MTSADKRTLSLSASGAIKTTPDKVDISTGVTSEAKTAREALDQNSEAMTKVVDALKDDGIDPKDIQTTNFSVNPVYDQRPYDKPQPPVVVGYRVTNQVRITLHDTKKLGAILDKVVTLGSNQIDSIEFGVDEPEALKDEARKLAMKNVTANAKLYAEAAGVGLGPILTISEEESSYQPRFAPAAARHGDGQGRAHRSRHRHGRSAGQGDLGDQLTGPGREMDQLSARAASKVVCSSSAARGSLVTSLCWSNTRWIVRFGRICAACDPILHPRHASGGGENGDRPAMGGG